MPKWEEMTERERDLLVAQTFFQWECDNSYCDGKMRIRCGACGRYGHSNCYGDGRGAIQLPCDHWPNYTGNIADAWQVAEKKRIAIVPQCDEAPDNMKYMAEIFTYAIGEPGGIRAFAPTAPEAICKAALKAVGVEV